MEWIDLLQWPAMVASVTGAWLVASGREYKRNYGFWCFLLGNLMWAVWGWHTGAWALLILQGCLAGLNIRGTRKTQAG